MNGRNARPTDHPSRWISRIGSGLALVGGLGGLIAVLVFTRSYLSSAYPELRLTPDLFTLKVLDARVSGFRFLAILAIGFLLSGMLAPVTAIKAANRLYDALVLLLGMALTSLSLLGGFSIGGYTIYAAIAVTIGGILLLFASQLQSPH